MTTQPTKMKTIELPEFGSAEVMTKGERPLPQPAAGEVLIQIKAAGINGPDIIQRRGFYPPPPGASDLMGLEVSGKVVALGSGVNNWKIGDKVCALTNGGGYAEYVAVEASTLPAHPWKVFLKLMRLDCQKLFSLFGAMYSSIKIFPRTHYYSSMAVQAELAPLPSNWVRPWDCEYSQPAANLRGANFARTWGQNEPSTTTKKTSLTSLRKPGGQTLFSI